MYSKLKKSSSQALQTLRPPDPFDRRRKEKPFFEKILMDQQAPKTYQHFHKAKKCKPTNRYRDIEQSATIIQKAWRRFKRTSLLHKIQQLEQPINAFKEGRPTRLPDTSHTKFTTLVIERLMLDMVISNKIIAQLQSECTQAKEEITRQNLEVKTVLQEYLAYIDQIIQQNQELQLECDRLKTQAVPHQLSSQLKQVDEGFKENIHLLSNKITNIETGQGDILTTLQTLMQQKELREAELRRESAEQLQTTIRNKDREIKSLREQLEACKNRIDQSTFDESDRSVYLHVERELRDISQLYQATLQKLPDFVNS